MNTTFTSSPSNSPFFSGKRFLIKPSEGLKKTADKYDSTPAVVFTDIAYSVASRALEGTNAFLEVRRPNGIDTFTSKFHYPSPPIIDYDQGKEAVIVEFVPAKPKKGYNNARGNLVEGTQADVEKAENAFIQSLARNKNLTMELLPDSPSQPN